MTVAELVATLWQYPPSLPICVRVDEAASSIAVEVQDASYLPADALVCRGEVVVLRAPSAMVE